jgi:hypothetical protein
MGVEPPAAQGGVAGEAVAFGVAGNAALQVLPSGLSVPKQERSLGVMIACVEPTSSGEPRADMAGGAELTGVVAIAATGLPGVGGGRMTGEKAGGMVARSRVRRGRTMTIETLGTDVTALARLGSRIGHWPMDL